MVQISCQKCEINAKASHFITFNILLSWLAEQTNGLNGENCCDQVFGHVAGSVDEGAKGRLQCWLRE